MKKTDLKKKKLSNQMAHSLLLASVPLISCTSASEKATTPPNIVLIVADDLGYGDVSYFNTKAKSATPNMDSLATHGASFTQAFSTSGVSTPSRYGILTGRYCFRSPLKSGAINGHGDPVIEKGRATIASILQTKGYHTAIIGKWHLGLEWQPKDPSIPMVESKGYNETTNIDYSKGVAYGPNNYGFEESFILPASLDMPPYLFLHNHHPIGSVSMLTRDIYPLRKEGTVMAYDTSHCRPTDSYWGRGVWWRQGEISDQFRVEECLQTINKQAISYIESQQSKENPFFLYLPLTSPHTPWVPDQQFVGTSQMGTYGDFIAHTDAVVGSVVKKLRELGMDKNTIVIVTSDNGAPWSPSDIAQLEHNSNEGRRGQKADVHDGGHHIPLIVYQPSSIKPKQVAEPVSLIDLFATIAEWTGYERLPKEGEDSQSMRPLLDGEKKGNRDHVVYHSSAGMFGLRKGEWKYIRGLGSGGFTKPTHPKPEANGPTGQLYRISTDPLEQQNLYLEYPDVVREMSEKLDSIIVEGNE